MRFKWIEIKNLTSLRGKHLIDFDRLSDENLFSIVGPTGSGKSTILNAISLALYGQLYKKNLSQLDLITLGEAKASIKLGFTVNTQYYLSVWSSRTLKKDGTPLKNPISTRELFRFEDGEKILCDNTIEEVIGLDFNQFSKTTILNQGEFSRFLTSSFAERKDILEKLCHLELLKDLSKILGQDLSELENKKSQKESELKAYRDGYIQIEPLQDQLTQLETNQKELNTNIEKQKKLCDHIKQISKVVNDYKTKNIDLKQTQDEKQSFLKEYEVLENEVHKSTKDFKQSQDYLKKNIPLLTQAINDKAELANIQSSIDSQNENKTNILVEIKEIKEKEVQTRNALFQVKEDLKRLNTQKKTTLIKQELNELIETHNQFLVHKNNRELLQQERRTKLSFYYEQALSALSLLKTLNTDLKSFWKTYNLLAKNQNDLTQAHYQKLNMDYQLSISSLIKSLNKNTEELTNCPVCEHTLSENDIKKIKQKTQTSHNFSLGAYQKTQNEKSTYEAKLSEFLNSLNFKLENLTSLQTKELILINDKINHLELKLKAHKQKELTLKDLQNELELINTIRAKEVDQNYLNTQLNENEKTKEKLNQKLKQTNESLSSLQDLHTQAQQKLKLFFDKDPKSELNKIQAVHNKIEEQKNLLNEKFKESSQRLNSLKDKIEYLDGQIKDYNMTYNLLRKSLSSLKLPDKIAEINIDVLNHALGIAEDKLLKLSDQSQEQNQTIGTLKQQIMTQKRLAENIKKTTNEINDITKTLGPKLELSQLISRDEFRNYVLKRVEENLVNQANIELKNLCDGRYRIILHSSKSRINEFYIQDLFLSSKERKISTLSGGETFMASLAMAMALSELSRGTTEIDAFFIDEGFATLDEDSLDDVMELLQKIKDRGKQVGVISHVEKLKSRISSSLILNKKHDGFSDLTQL